MKKLIFLIPLLIYGCGRDDAPGNTPPTVDDQIFTTPESTTSADVIGEIEAMDPDVGTELDFSLKEDPSGLFQVGEESGEIRLKSQQVLDFENTSSYTFTIEVSDGIADVEATITVNVSDVNEGPQTTDQQFSVAENITDQTVIGTVNASDTDMGSVLTFSIITNDLALFEIGPSTGDITLADGENLNFENKESHNLEIEVSDGTLKASSNVTINVEDANDPPTVQNQVFDVEENINDLVVIDVVAASDEDPNSTLSYSIITNDDGLFEINSATGELSLSDGLWIDFENRQTHQIEISVSDGELSTAAIVDFNVVNILDANVRTFASPVSFPQDLVVDPSGNVYVTSLNAIVKIDASGSASVYAGDPSVQGSNDGARADARFRAPNKLAIDDVGNIYVSDAANHTIRKIDTDGNVSTVAGIAGTAGFQDGSTAVALLNLPLGLALYNSSLFIVEQGNHSVRKIDLQTNIVSTVAGSTTFSGYVDGDGSIARFKLPYEIVVDGSGDLFIADLGNHCIRKIDGANQVSTLVGNGSSGLTDGTGSDARFFQPGSLALDGDGNGYVADTFNHTIRLVDSQGRVSTIAGVGGMMGDVDGQDGQIRLHTPLGVYVDANGAVYIADSSNNKIKKMEIK